MIDMHHPECPVVQANGQGSAAGARLIARGSAADSPVRSTAGLGDDASKEHGGAHTEATKCQPSSAKRAGASASHEERRAARQGRGVTVRSG
jgi:hypothetical protein